MRYRIRGRIAAGAMACIMAGGGGGGPAEGIVQQPPSAPPPVLSNEAVDALKDPVRTKALLKDAPRTKMEGVG